MIDTFDGLRIIQEQMATLMAVVERLEKRVSELEEKSETLGEWRARMYSTKRWRQEDDPSSF